MIKSLRSGHAVALAFASLFVFTLVEMGLTGEWLETEKMNTSLVAIILSLAVWNILFLLVHWTLPLYVAAVWGAFNAGAWLISAIMISTKATECITEWFFPPGRALPDSSAMSCLGEYPRWRSMIAFVWLNFLAMLFILEALWYHVEKKHVDWRQGVYGYDFVCKRSIKLDTENSLTVGTAENEDRLPTP